MFNPSGDVPVGSATKIIPRWTAGAWIRGRHFRLGSLSKIVVTLALGTIIEDLANSDLPEYRKYILLWNAWKRPFVECFNEISDTKLLDLPDNSSIHQLVPHFAGAPPLNRIITAPDGTPLISNEAFFAIIRQYTKDVYGESEWHWDYSNGNTILIGLLIEAISGMPLPDFADRFVFKRLGLTSASMSTKPGSPDAACPHEVSTVETTPISLPQTLSDPLCIAAMGACSNTQDIASFFQLIVESIHKATEHTAISYLCKPSADMGLQSRSRYYPCCISTTLNTTDLASRSLNRLVSPTSISSTYALGFEEPNNKPVRVVYHAGVINGFECSTYITPAWRAFLIIQSDTSGRVDATDHIYRLILQVLFNLKPLVGEGVNIPEMAELRAKERAKLLEEYTRSQSIDDSATAIYPSDIVGAYSRVNCRQTLLVREEEDKLWEWWQGSREENGRPVSPEKMQLLRVDETRVRMKVKLTVDRLVAWKNLDFKLSRDSNGRVMPLSRTDPYAQHNAIRYTRSLDPLFFC